MQSFFGWYGEATRTLREAARRERAAEHADGRRTPVEALSIDWDAWREANASEPEPEPEPGQP